MKAKRKALKPLKFQGFLGAASQIRTGDLILTKVADYTPIVCVYGNLVYFG